MGQKSEDEIARHRLGAAIRQLRAERKLTRRELERATGLSYPYLSEIEAGKKSPSTRTLRAIADALGLEAHDLLETAEAGADPQSRTAARRSRFHDAPTTVALSALSPARESALDQPRMLSPSPRRFAGTPPPVGSVQDFFPESEGLELGNSTAELSLEDQLERLAQLVADLSPEDLEILIELATRLRK
ncbi:MAG: helix-turn-helix domain-containing protein [Actinomycetota bacterium]|nr:helix-turn-helix domain-containing protein [Actinomycetota bacterium]